MYKNIFGSAVVKRYAVDNNGLLSQPMSNSYSHVSRIDDSALNIKPGVTEIIGNLGRLGTIVKMAKLKPTPLESPETVDNDDEDCFIVETEADPIIEISDDEDSGQQSTNHELLNQKEKHADIVKDTSETSTVDDVQVPDVTEEVSQSTTIEPTTDGQIPLSTGNQTLLQNLENANGGNSSFALINNATNAISKKKSRIESYFPQSSGFLQKSASDGVNSVPVERKVSVCNANSPTSVTKVSEPNLTFQNSTKLTKQSLIEREEKEYPNSSVQVHTSRQPVIQTAGTHPKKIFIGQNLDPNQESNEFGNLPPYENNLSLTQHLSTQTNDTVVKKNYSISTSVEHTSSSVLPPSDVRSPPSTQVGSQEQLSFFRARASVPPRVQPSENQLQVLSPLINISPIRSPCTAIHSNVGHLYDEFQNLWEQAGSDLS